MDNECSVIENECKILIPYLKDDFAQFIKDSLEEGMHKDFISFSAFAQACVDVYEEMKTDSPIPLE